MDTMHFEEQYEFEGETIRRIVRIERRLDALEAEAAELRRKTRIEGMPVSIINPPKLTLLREEE